LASRRGFEPLYSP